jgi:hypothetical protein
VTSKRLTELLTSSECYKDREKVGDAEAYDYKV